MGWWSRSSPTGDASSAQPSQPAQQPPTPTPDPTAQPPRTLTREEQADLEFKQLLASLEGDINRANAQAPESPISPSTSSSATPSSTSAPQSQPQSQSPPNIAPDSLYPDTMSCRSAFDYAFFCQSFGGQFVNVYRYGELRSCSEHWDNFWLCMKTRTWSEDSKKKAIRDHYRKKAIKYKTGPSSEDVWDLRTRPVQDAFQGDFAALEREMEAEEGGV